MHVKLQLYVQFFITALINIYIAFMTKVIVVVTMLITSIVAVQLELQPYLKLRT